MRMLIAFVFGKLRVNNMEFRAAICKQCGTKVYPITSLKAHLEYHESRKRVLEQAYRSIGIQ